MNEDVSTRVASGIYWLREHAEEYGLDVTKVDLDRLDVWNSQDCVLAQAIGQGDDGWSPYGDAIQRIFGDRWPPDASQWAIDYGFAAKNRADADALNDEWRSCWRLAVLHEPF